MFLRIYILIQTAFLFVACNQSQKIVEIKDVSAQCEFIVEDNFNSNLSNWIIEQREGGTASIKDGQFDIDDFAGCTAWFNQKFEGNVMIEYDALVIDQGGDNDRVSDLNCFWMAKDIYNPNDFFATSDTRNGKFQNYHNLQLYYVGLGGHDNTKTRFRRYEGGGERPCLPEHDLDDPNYLINANKVNKIRLIVFKDIVQYYFNGQLVFDYLDDKPYKEGYFGIRTYKNHLTIDNFKVYKLKK